MVGYLGMTLTLVTYIATDWFFFYNFENCLIVKGFFFFTINRTRVFNILKENENDIIEP